MRLVEKIYNPLTYFILRKTFKLRSLWIRKSYLKTQTVRKLHIGCGPYSLDGWLNGDNLADYQFSVHNKVHLDATKALPFPDNSFHYVFFEHLIEHLSYEESQQFLSECFRVLAPGGKIRIATPDIEFLVGLFSQEKSDLTLDYINWAHSSFQNAVKKPTPTFVMNNFFYAWGHSFIFDKESLQELVELSGFNTVLFYKTGESNDVHLKNIEQHGKEMPEEFNKLETMCLEATKPLQIPADRLDVR